MRHEKSESIDEGDPACKFYFYLQGNKKLISKKRAKSEMISRELIKFCLDKVANCKNTF